MIIKPSVTVIIPNYNKSMYLEQCIESVASQTYRPLEILVVDDASKDNSLQVLEGLKQKYPMLRVIPLEKNGGVSHARNTGIELASGEIITMLDSDDFYINPHKIENEVNAIEAYNVRDAFAYSKTVFVDENSERMANSSNPDKDYMTGNILKRLIKCKGLKIVPRDYCFSKKIALDPTIRYNQQMNFFEDTDFLIKLAAKADAVCTYEEGTAYRQNTNGLSNKPEIVQYRQRWKVSKRNIKLLSNPLRRLFVRIYLCVFRIRFETKLLIKNILKRRK